MGFIMPLPQMWLGRQPKGWVQTILLTPLSASSRITRHWMTHRKAAVDSPLFTGWRNRAPPGNA